MLKLLTAYAMEDYDAVIKNIYQVLHQQNVRKIADKIEWISRQFLGKPYLVGALGEGPQGYFDQSPLYRTDYFDCLTFVNTVLALAISTDLIAFQKNILRVNYYDADPKYEKRFHFMSVDWNPQNATLGLIKDITQQIQDVDGNPMDSVAVTTIDRPHWFLHRTLADIKLLQPIAEIEKRLQALRDYANKVVAEEARTSYLPFEKIFIHNKPVENIFAQIPNGAIIEMVRPAWDLRDKIGTHLNVSHLGFVFRIKDELIFRHASSLDKQVIDVPLVNYLQDVCLTNKTIRGINIQAVR